MTDEPWPAKIAAERLASLLVEVLDFAGRVDLGVTRGDAFYVADKAAALSRVAARMGLLASELAAEETDLAPHLPLIESKLRSAGQLGYPLVALSHPLEVAR